MQEVGGISRYFVELMKALGAAPALGVTPQPGWRVSRNRYAHSSGLGVMLPRPIRRGSACRLVNRMARLPESDLVHLTFYRADSFRGANGLPTVATVHDMIPEQFPAMFPDGSPHAAKQAVLNRADAVICVSNTTKSDLIQHFGSRFRSAAVVPLGVSDAFRQPALTPLRLPGSYVLFVGDRTGYKDFPVLLDAMAIITHRVPDTWLVCVGGGRWSPWERETIARAGLADRCARLDLTDDELVQAYRSTEAFVFPSRYEGFGLPTLEAMAAGAPALLANTPALEEVGDQAALYFTASDAGDLAEKLMTVLLDRRERERLRGTGQSRASVFTWSRTAALTASVYRGLVDNTT